MIWQFIFSLADPKENINVRIEDEDENSRIEDAIDGYQKDDLLLIKGDDGVKVYINLSLVKIVSKRMLVVEEDVLPENETPKIQKAE